MQQKTKKIEKQEKSKVLSKKSKKLTKKTRKKTRKKQQIISTGEYYTKICTVSIRIHGKFICLYITPRGLWSIYRHKKTSTPKIIDFGEKLLKTKSKSKIL